MMSSKTRPIGEPMAASEADQRPSPEVSDPLWDSKLNAATILLLILVFFYSGVDKVFHYEGFVNALRDYLLVPRGTAHLVAMPVILVELLIAISLLIKPWRRPAALTTAVCLLIFSTALAINHFYGDRGICGCWFTVTLAPSTTLHIAQNLVMATLALVLWSSEETSHADIGSNDGMSSNDPQNK